MSIWRYTPPFAPIMGFIGHNGAGKSALAVYTALSKAAEVGKPVWSNIPLSFDGVETLLLERASDLAHARDGIVLWDDVSGVAPARETMGNSAETVMRLKSLRHQKCALLWTSPALPDVDVDIRKVTQLLVAARGVRVRPVPGELWPRTTLSLVQTYDMRSPTQVEVGADTPRVGWGFRRLATLYLDAYDSEADIELIADEALCVTCGRRRRREYCRCASH